MGATEVIIPGEDSQKEEDKYRDVTYIWEVKYGTKELISPTEADSQYRKETSCCLMGGCWEEKDWEFGVSRCKLLYTGWIDEKFSLYSTGKHMQELKNRHAKRI